MNARRASITAPDFVYDEEDPPGFRSGHARLGPGVGARKLGATVYELPPGQSLCPYHYEVGEEEAVLVLAGRPTLRTPRGEERLAPDDVVWFPPGPEDAHALRNDTEETVRLFFFSTVELPAVTVYPDSAKILASTGDRASSLMAPYSARVPYFHGE